MKNTKRISRHINFPNITATLSILISVIVLMKDYYQNERITQISYLSSAAQFRPNLKIAGNLKTSISALMSKGQGTDSLGAREIPAILPVSIKMKCVNVGNSIARVITTFLTNTKTGDDKLRMLLTDSKNRQNELIPVPFNNFYKTQDLSSGDTISIETAHMVTSFQHERITLHFLILYENEMGALFDTYFWAQFEVGPFILRASTTFINGKKDVVYSALMPSDGVELKLIDSHSSTQMYSQENAKYILDYLSLIERR
ncbi:MAG: hypothetical protein HYZ10_14465 [Ignavibacteriales bacterium]|nr:hypothetical protein [Ignavibacteriales bacterium]